MYSVSKLLKTEMFQGKNKTKNYFEGWYFKLSDETGGNSLAVIPGVSYGESKDDRHAFIQVLDESSRKSHYFRFDISSFCYSESEFSISIGGSSFGRNGIFLDIDEDGFAIRGSLEFKDIVPFPKTIYNPGVMGPFSFIPFMECFHGVVNIASRIEGSLTVDGKETEFTGGRGYIEKDWGRSFPEWWIWLHSDRFEREDVQFMFSVAKIPWLGMHFTGFLSFLRVGGELYRFATYTGAKIKLLESSDGNLKIVVRDRKYSLVISGRYEGSSVLKAPAQGRMLRDIRESVSSEVHVSLKENKGRIIFEGTGRNAGMEIERS
ncbi:MAG TPA: tocopherol cyclase family protein [Clostridiaceae bacterium]|nr:tocopherol cyclase family protein [Clostridiaceae bacterium]